MNKSGIVAIALLAAMTMSVEAGHRHKHWDRHYSTSHAYGSPDHQQGARSTTEYADVVSVKPRYRSVRIEQPRRECWDEEVVYRQNNQHHSASPAAGALIGAIIGGVTGHQFGKGRGKHAATAVGAVIGAGVGQKAAARRHGSSQTTTDRIGYEEVCRTVTDYRTEERVHGYEVEYRYGGRTYYTTMRQHPGNRIPINVAVSPAAYQY